MTEMNPGVSAAPSELDRDAVLRGGLVDRFIDACNPVLVKEIRQAQRGKVFAIALILSVMLALLAATMMGLTIHDAGDKPGRDFFTVIYVFLAAATMLVVPFQAFISMGAEWDDHTLEMLTLSNLKPRQIVVGKILAALVQGLLFTAAFLPFIAVAFLLRGVDVVVLGAILSLTLLNCLWLSTVATMLSTLTRNRFLRVLLMVAMASALFGVVAGASGLASEWLRRPDVIFRGDTMIFMVQAGVFAVLSGILALCISCNLLAHEEENRSTNLRVLFSVYLVAFFGMLITNMNVPTIGMPREAVLGATLVFAFLLTFCGIFFSSEADFLGRRVRPTVPKSRLLALLTAPWYPGGGRGVLFVLVHWVALVGGGLALATLAPGFSTIYSSGGAMRVDRGVMDSGGLPVLMSLAYIVLYALLPVGMVRILAPKTPGGRAVTRVAAIFSPLFYLLVPSIFGLIVGDYQLQGLWHVGNPARVIGESWEGDLFRPGQLVFLMLPLVALGLVLALPRAVHGLKEMLEASADRRLGPAPAPDAEA